MSTYNGDRYLENQIESLLAQEDIEACILARDDGSSDNTLEILDRYKKVYSEEEVKNKNCKSSFNYCVGQNLGPAGSFLDLMKQAPEAEYYALCDQDDTWLPDKLRIAVEAIKQREGKDDTPILYYGMPRFADNDGNLLKGPKGIYEKSLDFPSCLIKSNSTGCTMVFNRTLLELINRKSPNLNTITMHDEWLHKVCLAVGGILIYDEDVNIIF